MKGKIQVQQQPQAAIEPGTYEATLERVTAWTSKRYQSDNYEPSLTFVWVIGNGSPNPVRVYDPYVRVPLTRDGWPALNDGSRLYNRLSALYGARFDVHDPGLEWELRLPDIYDSPEGLAALPRVEERHEEGFNPIEVRSITVNGRELLGASCLITVARNKSGYLRVVEAIPMPRKF